MTSYQQGGPPANGPDPRGQATEQIPNAGGSQPGAWEQQQAQVYAQAPYQPPRQRPHFHVRSTFLTSEFWVLVVVSLGILIAAAFTGDDGPGDRGFGAHDAWKYITWLAIGYVLSRGLTKLGGARRDGGDTGESL